MGKMVIQILLLWHMLSVSAFWSEPVMGSLQWRLV